MTAMKKPLRVYADTSVFGGCFDDEFKTGSVRFFEEVRQGRFVVVVSTSRSTSCNWLPTGCVAYSRT